VAESPSRCAEDSRGTAESGRHNKKGAGSYSRPLYLCQPSNSSARRHQQSVVPGAVGSPFVLAQHANPLEANPPVGADRVLVGEPRVDCEAMVLAFPEEVARERADRIRPVAAALERLGERDVHRRVAVHRVGLFAVLDEAGDHAAGNDQVDAWSSGCAVMG
jgi:hypothetical protein